jgi:hypothetical protein
MSRRSPVGDFRISMRISVESVMCRFGTGARTLLLLAMMSLVEITAMGPPSYSTSVYVPAAMRAVAVLTPFSVHDYIESEGILFPRGMVPKYPKMIPDFKPIDDFIHHKDSSTAGSCGYYAPSESAEDAEDGYKVLAVATNSVQLRSALAFSRTALLVPLFGLRLP